MYKLGIIGFGIVGKSILAFLSRQKVVGATASTENELFDDSTPQFGGIHVQVWDARPLGLEEKEIVAVYKANAVDATKIQLKDFILDNDFIIASPGVDLSKYQEYSDKFMCELDFFSAFFSKQVVAITGSVGKTTITKLIGKLASVVPLADSEQPPEVQGTGAYGIGKKCLRTVIGGNVGIGMLDLIQQQDMCDVGVLELSSFQLELNRKFAPDIALWTNWYPNHLDRHQTPHNYFEAKFNLLRYQCDGQIAILSDALFEPQTAQLFNQRLDSIRSTLFVCCLQLNEELVKSIQRTTFYLFYLDGETLCKALVHKGLIHTPEKLFDMSCLPEVTFKANWVQVLVALYALKVDLAALRSFLIANQGPLLESHKHRVELFLSYKGVDFYDDSKSTLVQSTLAAVEKLADVLRPLIVILGGLDKGVDRRPMVEKLLAMSQVKKIYYFGNDARAFDGCEVKTSLDDVIKDILKIMTPGDQVLFSPSGSSYDFFKNYEHRGQVFKETVKKMLNV